MTTSYNHSKVNEEHSAESPMRFLGQISPKERLAVADHIWRAQR